MRACRLLRIDISGRTHQPERSLSTLRPADCSDATQDSLSIRRAQLRSSGTLTRWAPIFGFRAPSLHLFLQSQAFLARPHASRMVVHGNRGDDGEQGAELHVEIVIARGSVS